MECKICGKKLSKNGVKKGIQYYYCTHCKKSYSGKPHKANHHIFEEYIAKLLYEKCIRNENKFTQTKWTINQIARLLGYHHRDIKKWIQNKIPSNIDKSEFSKYLKNRENGFDISCVLGFTFSTTPSENLNNIIHRKERAKTQSESIHFHITEAEYIRLINMPISNRKEAIFILGALLGCRTSEILGAKYSDINYTEKTINFHRVVTLGKEVGISENSRFVSNRTYPLTQRMFDVIAWLKTNAEQNKIDLGENYNHAFSDFLCVQEYGNFIAPFALNRQTQDLQAKIPIVSKFYIYGAKEVEIKEFQFKWLRYSVRQMMLKAGVNKEDIDIMFGYRTLQKDSLRYSIKNQLDIMRNAYDILDKYITMHGGQ